MLQCKIKLTNLVLSRNQDIKPRKFHILKKVKSASSIFGVSEGRNPIPRKGY